jgi:hypothetical protein
LTIVIAKKFDERIVTVSDTADFDVRNASPNLVPGVLKSVIVNLHTSISFAGATERCLDAIRKIHKQLLAGADLTGVLNDLAKYTSDGKCEFLVSAHRNTAELRKIACGRVTDALSVGWIGDSQAIKKTVSSEKFDVELPDYMSQGEAEFTYGFIKALGERKMLSDFAGGIPIVHLASAIGHTYQDYMNWSLGGTMLLTRHGFDPKSVAERTNHQYDFTMHVIAPDGRGVAVLGLYFVEARCGFIYSPIETDNPDKLTELDIDQFRTVVNDKAHSLGGVIVD